MLLLCLSALALLASLYALAVHQHRMLLNPVHYLWPHGDAALAAEKARWAGMSEAQMLGEAVGRMERMRMDGGRGGGGDGGEGIATHESAGFAEYRLVDSLDPALVPQPRESGSDSDSDDADGHGSGRHGGKGMKGRLIVVGDIHGMLDELQHLLRKVEFENGVDHLVCTGDMIAKGPDSAGVVKLLMELGASAVRGNWEDKMLLSLKSMEAEVPDRGVLAALDAAKQGTLLGDEDIRNEEDRLASLPTFSKSKEFALRKLSREFSKSQIHWLRSLPVILRIGTIRGLGTVVAVHGGLVPGLKLTKQDPYSVMNMRTLDARTRVPSERHKGLNWTKLWNAWQAHLERRGEETMTVLYGHDSRRGLVIEEWTKGLDSGCLKGGRLSAFVIEGGHKKIRTEVVSVKCRDGRQ
jgi:hypothetical protein